MTDTQPFINATHPQAQQVLNFWFDKATKPFWFKKSIEFDASIRRQFFDIWERAAAGECAHWRYNWQEGNFSKASEKLPSLDQTDTTSTVKSTLDYDKPDNIAGRLAEIIVLDQFSRNLFRDSPTAFTQDTMALVLAQEAIKSADFKRLPTACRNFILMPFMHSESSQIHANAIPYFEHYADQSTLKFELKHKHFIDKFGRYPHRNAILGRVSSAEERQFLTQKGSSF